MSFIVNLGETTIPNFPDYTIDKKGEVMNKISGRIKKHSIVSGYSCVRLTKDRKTHVLRLHILLANIFLPNPHVYLSVRHVDGNKFNNNLSNLMWFKTKLSCKNNTGDISENIRLGYAKVPFFKTYIIYTYGVVTCAVTGSILSTFLKNDFRYVELKRGKYTKILPISVLLAKLFIYNPDNKAHVVHRDGNTLNDSVENLFWNDIPEILHNSKSRFRGVNYCKLQKQWISNIYFGKIKVFIGYFDNEIAAAKAYDEAALRYHETEKKLNFPDLTEQNT
jgi:hypothetical protein